MDPEYENQNAGHPYYSHLRTIPTGATVNTSGKPKGHESYARNLVGPIMDGSSHVRPQDVPTTHKIYCSSWSLWLSAEAVARLSLLSLIFGLCSFVLRGLRVRIQGPCLYRGSSVIPCWLCLAFYL